MSGNSSVGQSSVYEAGDQRNYKDSELNDAERYNEGKANSHLANDSSKTPPNPYHHPLSHDHQQMLTVSP